MQRSAYPSGTNRYLNTLDAFLDVELTRVEEHVRVNERQLAGPSLVNLAEEVVLS